MLPLRPPLTKVILEIYISVYTNNETSRIFNIPDPVHIAVIGGTGLRELPNFTQVASLNITTPWGQPSSPITILHHTCSTSGKVVPVAFLSRHGLHHEYAPHEVPARANIAALRSIGVRSIVAFSAVGSLQEAIKPRDFVVPDQVIDRTKGVRPWTFFEGGAVAHVGFADPFDEQMAKVVRDCGHSLEGDGVVLHDRGTLICMGMVLFPSPSFSLLYVVPSFERIKAKYSITAPSTINRGPTIQHTRREQPLPRLGRQRNQHVLSSRGKARTGS